MPRRIRRQFLWIPPNRNTARSITIGTTDVTNDVNYASFTHGLIGVETGCEIELDNNGEKYNLLKAEDDIIFKMDFSDGTTVQFKGFVEDKRSRISDTGFVYIIRGSHLSGKLLDLTVTAEFDNATISDILKSIVDDNLTGYTYTNVETISTTVSVKWNNKSFYDCILDLMKLGDVDVYLDNDKDFHMFPKNSKNNDNNAIVWNDSLIELSGLGPDTSRVANKIIVYGTAGNLPVISTSEDSSSQTSFGIKERVITDTSVITSSIASLFSAAELLASKTPIDKGTATTVYMNSLNPGDRIYVISPPHRIHSRHRLVKYTFFYPIEEIEHVFEEELSIPQIFKDRILKDIGQEDIINPFKMANSYNFVFDDETNIDSSSSSSIETVDGNLQMQGIVETAVMITDTFDTTNAVTSVHLLVVGEVLTGVTYQVVADGSNNWKTIDVNTLEDVTSVSGTKLRLRINITSNSTRIDAVALLYK